MADEESRSDFRLSTSPPKERISSSTENPYKSLLLRFQRGHAEHGQTWLQLVLLTEDEVEERKSRRLPSLLGVDGYLSWDDPETGEPLFVAAGASVAAGLQGEFRDIHYSWAMEAWEIFKPLAREAGSHLPSSIRKAMPVEPHDAPGIWYTFLFWCAETQDFKNVVTPKGHEYIYRPLSNSVFKDSADAKEMCRLATDDPCLPPRLQSDGGQSEDASEEGGSNVKKKPRKRGRPIDTDLDEDRRISEAWDTGQHKSYVALARERGKNEKKQDITRAIDRHRKRSDRRSTG
jgi:hypothetical protein